jgi:hypothetical protein
MLRRESTRNDAVGQVLVNELSLTTPAVSRVFFLFSSKFEHTFPTAQEWRLFLSLLFICHPNLPSPLTFINSVLPTKHLSGYLWLC